MADRLPCRTTVIVPRKCSGAVQSLKKMMSQSFGGYTSWQGEGGWFSDRLGRIVHDDVEVIQSGHDCSMPRTEVQKRMQQMAFECGQAAISIVENNTYVISSRQTGRPEQVATLGMFRRKRE